MSKLRVYLTCMSCTDYNVDNAEKMIAHFRLEHGIKPETFSAEKRKAFYDSFQLAENEFSFASDEEGDDTNSKSPSTELAPLPVTQEEMKSEFPETTKYNLRKRHKSTEQPSTTKKRKTLEASIKFETVDNAGDVTSEGLVIAGSSEESWLPTSDDSIEQDLTLQRRSHTAVDTGQGSSKLVAAQQAGVKSSPNAGVSAEKPNPLSGTIYRCSHCSRSMGYAILQLHRHYRRYKGSCVLSKTRDVHFICPHCKTDYSSEQILVRHTKKFHGLCKHYQSIQSQNYLRRQEEGKIAVTLDKSEIESLQPIETDEEEDTTVLQPFTHRGYLIPVENGTSYKCPWCLRCLGNRIGFVRRHLSFSSGICYRDKVTSENPQCNLCLMHFSTMDHLVRHLKYLKGSCKRRGNIVDDVRVDLIRVAERRSGAKETPSEIFLCRHCDRCMGYSYRNLRNHLFVTQGKCRPKPDQQLYPCKVCKFDFTSTTSLNLHSKRYGGKCIDNGN